MFHAKNLSFSLFNVLEKDLSLNYNLWPYKSLCILGGANIEPGQ